MRATRTAPLLLHISPLCLQSRPSFAFVGTDDTSTPRRFCRVHSLHAGRFQETYFSEARASGSCLCEREERKEIARERERQKQACVRAAWLTLIPIRHWPLCSEALPREISLPASRSNWMPFLFCRASLFLLRRRALKREVVSDKYEICVPCWDNLADFIL